MVLLHSDHRGSRLLAYSALLVAGLMSFTCYNVTFVQGVAIRAIGVFILVGAAIALAGHVKRENRVEAIAMLLLIPAIASLALLALLGGGIEPQRFFLAPILLAYASCLHGRYRDLQALISMGERLRRATDG